MGIDLSLQVCPIDLALAKAHTNLIKRLLSYLTHKLAIFLCENYCDNLYLQQTNTLPIDIRKKQRQAYRKNNISN